MTLDRLYEAEKVIGPVINKTDLIKVTPPVLKECNLYLKTENLQTAGSFKVRGAYFKISNLRSEELSKGLIAC